MHNSNNQGWMKFDQSRLESEYALSDDLLAKASLSWIELKQIHDAHMRDGGDLEDAAAFIARDLQKIPGVHSIRYRIKNPDHLVEKIVRKNLNRAKRNEAEPSKDFGQQINFENYLTELKDFIGVRALHLFKNDWLGIHRKLTEDWAMEGSPTANYRAGDSDEILRMYTENGCITKIHAAGYRSVHYLLEFSPKKRRYIAELQVRTIFEEAWSEIDHQIRYPYDQENLFLLSYLGILNRLAGTADEMASFVTLMKNELENREQRANIAEEERNEALQQLENALNTAADAHDQVTFSREQIDSLKAQLDQLKQNREELDLSEYNPFTTSIGHAAAQILARAATNPNPPDVLRHLWTTTPLVTSVVRQRKTQDETNKDD